LKQEIKEIKVQKQEEREEDEEELDLPLVSAQSYTLPNTPSSARTDPQSSGKEKMHIHL
jgi:hypothetical protein